MNKRTLLGILIVILVVTVFTLPAFGEELEEEAVSFGWLSLLPPLLAIVLAFFPRQVLLYLFLGIFVGVTMANVSSPHFTNNVNHTTSFFCYGRLLISRIFKLSVIVLILGVASIIAFCSLFW